MLVVRSERASARYKKNCSMLIHSFPPSHTSQLNGCPKLVNWSPQNDIAPANEKSHCHIAATANSKSMANWGDPMRPTDSRSISRCAFYFYLNGGSDEAGLSLFHHHPPHSRPPTQDSNRTNSRTTFPSSGRPRAIWSRRPKGHTNLPL